MVRTTVSLRIGVPLYDLNGASFDMGGITVLPDVRLTVILVDSGVPTGARVVTRGAGSGVRVIGDSLGLLHNSRIDLDLPGPITDWDDMDRVAVASLINRVIDWYRVLAGRYAVRRIPFHHVSGYEARDTSGQLMAMMVPIGARPGDPSGTAGALDDDLAEKMRARIGRPLPLWLSLYTDARAESLAGELPVAVLLANSSMETLANRAFRAVAPPEEVAAAFSATPPPPFWQLLKRTHAIVQPPLSKTKMLRLAGRVHRHRDDVSHGNPVQLNSAVIEDALDALGQLGLVLDQAVVRFLRARYAAP